MITIYQEPTEKNPKFGMTWNLFESMQVCFTANKYDNVATAKKYIELQKAWVVISNFEAIRRYFQQWFPSDQIMQHHKETVQALTNVCADMLDHSEDYDLILSRVESSVDYIKFVAKNTPKEHKPDMNMMCIVLVQYCRNEINERKEDKAEVEKAEG